MKNIQKFLLIAISCTFILSCSKKNENYMAEIAEQEVHRYQLISFGEVCEIKCPNRGYRIEILQQFYDTVPQPNIYRFRFVPDIYTYVGQSSHSAGGPSNYVFFGFLMNSPQGTPPYRDLNGDLVTGNIYRYVLAPQLQTCDQVWQTNTLNITWDPCHSSNLNNVLTALNNSSNNPASTSSFCGTILPCNPSSGGGQPSGPGGVWGEDSPYWDVDFWTSNFMYGYECVPEAPGVCHDSGFYSAISTLDPNIGPIDMRLEGSSVMFKFWRDTELSFYEVVELNSELPTGLKDMYSIPENVKFIEGSYPISYTEDDYGQVVIELSGLEEEEGEVELE